MQNPTERADAVLRNLKESFERVNNALERDKSIDSSLSGQGAPSSLLATPGPSSLLPLPSFLLLCLPPPLRLCASMDMSIDVSLALGL